MSANRNYKKKDTREKNKHTTKREKILSLFNSGINDIEEIATLSESRSSYVASVLQQAGFLSSYFDLYTSTQKSLNIYSRFFSGKLGFKNQETAQQSINLIDAMYNRFKLESDRAGQHHALIMALTMYNRARWTNKLQEANVFRVWLIQRLEENGLT